MTCFWRLSVSWTSILKKKPDNSIGEKNGVSFVLICISLTTWEGECLPFPAVHGYQSPVFQDSSWAGSSNKVQRSWLDLWGTSWTLEPWTLKNQLPVWCNQMVDESSHWLTGAEMPIFKIAMLQESIFQTSVIELPHKLFFCYIQDTCTVLQYFKNQLNFFFNLNTLLLKWSFTHYCKWKLTIVSVICHK